MNGEYIIKKCIHTKNYEYVEQITVLEQILLLLFNIIFSIQIKKTAIMFVHRLLNPCIHSRE